MIRGLNKIAHASGLGYMMSSYTAHTQGLEAAHQQAVEIAADLLLSGLVVFAPIAYGTAIEKKLLSSTFPSEHDYIKSHEFWMAIDERFFERCDYGVLAMTPGWNKSTGIAIEFYSLHKRDIPIYFYDPVKGAFHTTMEACTIWPDEVEELIERAQDLKDTHLPSQATRSTSIMLGVLDD